MDAHVHIQMKCVHEQRLQQRLEEQEKRVTSRSMQTARDIYQSGGAQLAGQVAPRY